MIGHRDGQAGDPTDLLDDDSNNPAPRQSKQDCGSAIVCLQRLTAWSLMAGAIWAAAGQLGEPAMQAPVVELCVDINRADEREFRLLPTIGPKLAERIVRERNSNGPFDDVNAMARVDGIGGKTLELISNYCCVQKTTNETSRAISNRSTKRLITGSNERQIVSR